MKAIEKRGLSPVIATVLLVGIALVLASIVFLWAKNFIGEAVTKEGREITLFKGIPVFHSFHLSKKYK